MEHKRYDVAVIGAGAAGLMAAITAARTGGTVLVIEHMQQAGKKLLVTGNGHCNYTNEEISLSNYYCKEPAFVDTVLKQYGKDQVVSFFEELGIRPIQKHGGCIYPESEQASSIRLCLLDECERLAVSIVYSVQIQSLNYQNQFFQIRTNHKHFHSKCCILATGGCSYDKTGADGSGYPYALQNGHTLVPPLPALVALEADFSKYRLPAGVRVPCQATLCIDKMPQATEQGELQITEYGLSGILIFQFSRIAARALTSGQTVFVELDFKPNEQKDSLLQYLDQRFSNLPLAQKTMKKALSGFVPDKLIPVLLQKAGIREKEFWNDCTQIQKQQFLTALKRFRVKISGTRSFNQAQTTTGGIDISEIDARTMASKIVPGLYFAGEIIDVDAKCGGYNLQWAWSTGHLAGVYAAKQGNTSASHGGME